MTIWTHIIMGKYYRGFPGHSVVKNLPAIQEDTLEKETHSSSNPLQYSCLEKSHG